MSDGYTKVTLWGFLMSKDGDVSFWGSLIVILVAFHFLIVSLVHNQINDRLDHLDSHFHTESGE